MTKKKSGISKTSRVISATVVICVFVGLNFTIITSLFSQIWATKSLYLSFASYSEYSSLNVDNLDSYVSNRFGVPNYVAQIYLTFETRNVQIGKTVRFRIQVIDVTGNLKKPYFYIFLCNNTDRVCSAFPESVWVNDYYKLKAWSSDYDGVKIYTDGHIYSIPRKTLMDGYGDYEDDNRLIGDTQIWFEKEIENSPRLIGKWSVFVILFDDKYYTPEGAEMQSENAVAYIADSFDVTPQSIPTSTTNESFAILLRFLASLPLTLFSIYAMFAKISPWIDSHSKDLDGWVKRNKIALGVLIGILFAYVVIILWILET